METDNKNDKGKAILQESSSQQRVGDNCISSSFPAGLRVLVVDDDRTCLLILEKMLQICQYEVTKCRQAKVAVSMLRDDKNKFDIVVIDLHMPDMDGFKLLEIAGLEMNLPVVMMSSDEDHEVIMKGVLHGACDYLIKPIRIEALRTIWQHVIRKYKDTAREELARLTKPSGNEDKIHANTGTTRSSKRRKTSQNDVDDDDDDTPDPASTGKKRLIWTDDLHEKFVRAVNHLGPGNAVPLKILECLQQMNVHGITREHVASHLQKYRMNLRKLDSNPPPKYEHFRTFEQSQSLDNLQFPVNMSDTRQFPLPILTDQQASVPVPLNAIPNISSTFDDPGKQFLHFAMLESNYNPITGSSVNDFTFSGALGGDPWCNTPSSVSISSFVKEYGCRNKENVAPNSQSMLAHDLFDEFYAAKGETTHQLIHDPSLCFQHFDQNEIFHEPFIQQGTAPLLIKYDNATEFDK